MCEEQEKSSLFIDLVFNCALPPSATLTTMSALGETSSRVLDAAHPPPTPNLPIFGLGPYFIYSRGVHEFFPLRLWLHARVKYWPDFTSRFSPRPAQPSQPVCEILAKYQTLSRQPKPKRLTTFSPPFFGLLSFLFCFTLFHPFPHNFLLMFQPQMWRCY